MKTQKIWCNWACVCDGVNHSVNLVVSMLLIVIDELVQGEDLALGSGSSCYYFMNITIEKTRL